MVHPINKIVVLHRVLNPLFMIVSVTVNGAQPSVFNLLANIEALPANTEATKSSNGTQLTITNLPTNTETISNTQHRNSLAVTNKENISNKSGHSTATL